MYIIPLTTQPNQTFNCTIPIDGQNRRLSFALRYNSIADYWNLTVIDGVTNETLIDAIPLQRGQFPAANLLEQYSYMKIGSAVIVHHGKLPPDANPNDRNLGAEFYLVWGDTVVS
jgi:hypothetical protein